jgi:hypothetical protein
MISITQAGTVRRVRPQFHATLYAPMRIMTAVFGQPDLLASSLWVVSLDLPGAGHAKQVLLVPDLAASGFDPAAEPGRPAVWQIISDRTAAGPADQDAPDGVFAPVIAAVRAAMTPADRITLPWWPADAGCEYSPGDLCDAEAVAVIASQETGDRLWCCGPHAVQCLESDPGAYPAWVKPGVVLRSARPKHLAVATLTRDIAATGETAQHDHESA